MPVIPNRKPKTNSAPEVLNAIRNAASITYRNYVPFATPDAESVKAIGTVIMDNVALQNEFVSLINRIAAVYVTSKLYENPWATFKKGEMELGETIEEVFLNLPTAHVFDPETAETNVFKREIPDVRATFHVVNYQEFYKQTVEREVLAHAFTSWGGVDDFIARIVNGMASAAAYDEFIVMKYMLAKRALLGQLYISTPSGNTDETLIADAKAISNKMEFMSSEYNLAGVNTYCKKPDQFFIETAAFDATSDVFVLAKAFNMDKVEFMGRRMLVDSFSFNRGELDRLAKIFDGDADYTEFNATELSDLETIQLVIVDKDYFMVFDKLNKMTEIYNGEGLYWNEFFHVWRIFGASPFANAVMFAEPGTISGVTISFVSSTSIAGGLLLMNYTAAVAGSGFYNHAVTWSSSDETKVTVDDRGVVTVIDQTIAPGDITITATSVGDPSATATIDPTDDM